MDFYKEIFKFESSAHSSDTFGVIRFEGAEGLSRLFEFTITLISREIDIDWDAMVDKPAAFTILRDGESVHYHGILKSFDVLGSFHDRALFRAVLVPALFNLTLLHHNQIFLGKAVPDILAQILKEGGLTTRDFETRLQASYATREYACQYQESHFEFLSRWMEREGMYYFFEHGGAGSKMVITDSRLAHQPAPHADKVRYSPQTGLDMVHLPEVVHSLVGRRNAVSKSVSLKDYNYRKPGVEISGQAEGGEKGRGDVHLFGEHARDGDESKALAKARGEAIKCREHVFHGSGAASFLRSGYTFTLTDHFRKDFNRTYLVTDTHHQGTQAAYLSAGLRQALAVQETEAHYSVDFTAIPADTQFRPERITPKPRIFGVLSAKIDASGSGQYAELDEHGRYKVIMPFDQSGRSGGKASHYLRMMQPYAGSEHGHHFPLHKGVEVLITFIHGNPDMPVIAGAVPNPDNPSLVNQDNQTQSILQTGGKNKVLFEDKENNEGVFMKSPTGNTYVRLGSAPGREEETEEPNGFRFHTEDDYIEEIGSNFSSKICGNEIDILIGAKEEVVAGAATELNAGATTEVTLGQAVEMTLGAVIEAKKGISVEIGETNRIGISESEELIGAKKVELKAGGSMVGVGKALAAALSASASITSSFAAAAAKHDPSSVVRVPVTASIASVTGLLSAITYAFLAKTKIPNSYASTLEMDNSEAKLVAPKVEVQAKTGGVKVKAAQKLEMTANEAKIKTNSDMHIESSSGEIEIKAPTGGITLSSANSLLQGTAKSVKFTASDELDASAPKIALKGMTSVTIETDSLTWKPVAAGRLKAGPVEINAITGQVKIG